MQNIASFRGKIFSDKLLKDTIVTGNSHTIRSNNEHNTPDKHIHRTLPNSGWGVWYEKRLGWNHWKSAPAHIGQCGRNGIWSSSSTQDSPCYNYGRSRTQPSRKHHSVPSQTSSLALRAKEDWERSVCENKAIVILNKCRQRKKTLIKKDGGEMLIAVVLDRPFAEAQALVQDAEAFMRAITKILQAEQNYPVIAQMLNPDVRDDLPPSAYATGSTEMTRPPEQLQTRF